MRKAREQVKLMVADEVSLPKIKRTLIRWGLRWVKTSGTWNYQELSVAYIQSCWETPAAEMAAWAFQQEGAATSHCNDARPCAGAHGIAA